MASEIEHHHGQPTAPTGSIGGSNADTAFDEPRTSRSFTDFNAAPLTVSTDWREESRQAGKRITAAVGEHQNQLGFPSLGDDDDDDDSSAATTASADKHYLHVNGNGHGGSNKHGSGGSEDGIGSGSETMTSPSVTSPPYWAHGHGRTVSNVSVESVLPAGAITLQDNECDDDDDQNRRAANVIGRDRNRACWAKSVEITDSVMVNGSTTNIGAFVVWNIRVQTLNGSHMNIRKRYSEFDDLRRRLVQTFPGFEAAVPVLPPKSILSNFKPRFLEKRRAGLQYFLK
ncbi:Phox homologous domain-containing protein [Lasiosphaeria miniovina]|uniref:Endosomal/vacuolar adapter protein YPT35 n=1 Tax=Lasiosphaeria miniovina TaxID=1954250 RepID=A0AA40EGB0_9PEZI|nr:Phox domain-containing protein [Lasiosphaeria miniovina]KAK0734283.1 Phox homologous domain-containing protein [Lasiosphaeria miniovina]